MVSTSEANNTRELIKHLKVGSPCDVELESCGKFSGIAQGIKDAFQQGKDAGEKALGGAQARHPEFKTLINSTEPSQGRFDLRWLQDALKELAPITWVVKGLFPKSSMSVIYGKPGCMKTWIGLYMALCVASGRDFLGRKTKQGTALYIDEENGSRRLGHRIKALANGLNLPANTPMAFASLSGLNLSRVADVDDLERLIEDNQSTFVVIDTLAAATLGVDENTVREMQPILGCIRRIAERTGAAILVLHHANKAGDFRGSSSIAGAVDHLMEVVADEDKSSVEIKSVKARDVEAILIRAHLRFEAPENGMPTVVRVGTEERPPKKARLKRSEEFVMAVLREKGKATTREIQEATRVKEGAPARSTVRQVINALLHRKLLMRVDDGLPGKMATYAIANIDMYQELHPIQNRM